MHRILFLLLLVFGSANAQSTAKIDLLSKVADEICNDITLNKVTIRSEGVLGLYMIKALNNHKKEVEEIYGTNVYANEEVFAELGEELGAYMGLKCPEVFVEFLAEYDTEEVFESRIEGQLTKINKGQFLTFIVQETSGKKHEFLLLYDFETAYMLTDGLLKLKIK